MFAFTLVSLMLSLFGGIFAALSAFRNFSDGDIKARCDRMDLHMTDLEKNLLIKDPADHRKVVAEKHAGTIRRARRIWTFAQLLPTAAFLAFAIFMAGWAVWNWEVLHLTQNWVGWKRMVLAGIFVDLAALFAMGWAWWWLRGASTTLDDHISSLKLSNAGIQPETKPLT